MNGDPTAQTVAYNITRTDSDSTGELTGTPLPEFRDVNIERVENGFALTIGCKRFVSTSWEEVSEGLKLYFTNPKEAQKKYCRKENQ